MKNPFFSIAKENRLEKLVREYVYLMIFEACSMHEVYIYGNLQNRDELSLRIRYSLIFRANITIAMP